MSKRRIGWIAALACAVPACAVRLGGPSPQEYQAIALPAGEAATSAEVAERIQSVAADLVLLAAQKDSAWFAEVATSTGLQLSGPGTTGPTALAFMANLELLGDTSIVLAAGEGRMHMHDALYRIDENRLLDLMLVDVQPEADLREAVRTMLSYIATDVGATAAVLLGVQAPTPQAGDSITVLIRAAFANARECAARTNDGGAATEPGRIRLYYGPAVRMDCLSARTLPGEGPPITARLLVGR